MKRWRIVLSVALALGVQAVALAQAGPDFSGTWRFNQEKSSQGIAGNSPDLPFPSQLVELPTNILVASSNLRVCGYGGRCRSGRPFERLEQAPPV